MMDAKKSAILRTCKNCLGVYEVDGFQSNKRCERCFPIRKCAHGIKITHPCRACIAVHGNPLIRVM